MTLQLGAITLAECGENSQYNAFLQMLAGVTSFGMRGDQLVLVVDGGATTMSFNDAGPAAPPETQPEPPPFVDFLWYWQGTNFTNGNQVLVSNPSGYTIRFLSDGTLEGQADCNSFGGEYTIADSSLTIQLGPMTLVAWPPDSLDSDYLEQLSQVADYTLQGENLYLNLVADAGSMIFNKRPLSLAPAATPTFTQIPPTTTNTPKPVVIVPTATPTKPPTTSTNECKVISAKPQGLKLKPKQSDADMRAELRNMSKDTWKGNEIDFVLIDTANGVKIHKGADVWDLGVDIAPDGTYIFSLDLVAPDEKGTFGETWAMKRGKETLCSWSIYIIVEKSLVVF
jgi:heat shock protein HslJ